MEPVTIEPQASVDLHCMAFSDVHVDQNVADMVVFDESDINSCDLGTVEFVYDNLS
jgi:hypothetical protein